MDVISDGFKEAENGKRLWLEIKSRYDYKDDDLLILLPPFNKDMNKVAIQYLTYYIEKKYINRAFVLHEELDFSIDNSNKKIKEIEISEEQLNQLICLYRLLQFEHNIIAIIPKMPFASPGIIGKKGITIADYVKDTFFEQVTR